MEDKYNVDKLEFWNRIRLGLEDQLLKNHDIKVDYDIKYHYSYDGIIFGTIGHYERDWFNILELKNNLSGRQDGAEKAINEIADELVVINHKLVRFEELLEEVA